MKLTDLKYRIFDTEIGKYLLENDDPIFFDPTYQILNESKFELELWTGFKDAYQKSIFVGDIVEVKGSFDTKKMQVIQSATGEWQLVKGPLTYCLKYIHERINIVVVGNVHSLIVD